MNNEYFVNPQEDPAAEDPFAGPADDSEGDAIGASPAAAGGVARTPVKRKALFLAGGGVAAVLMFLVIFGRSGEETVDAGPAVQSLDSMVVAQGPAAGDDPLQRNIGSMPTVDDPMSSSSGGGSGFLDPTQFEPNDPVSPAGGAPDPWGVDPEAAAVPTQVMDPTTGQMYTPQQPGGLNGAPAQDPFASDSGGGMPSMSPEPVMNADAADPNAISEEEVRRQDALNAAREAEERRVALRQQLEEQRKAEEARLRGAGTRVAENGAIVQGAENPPAAQGQGGAAAAGASRFGDGGSVAPTGSFSDSADDPSNGVLPGTQVAAILESKFESNAEGGQVKVVLSAPLRTTQGVVLPAGTEGYGQATASGGQAGQPARVSLQVSTWKTPDDRVIRGSLTATAMDPETRAMAIPAKVNRHYGQQIIRGLASTAIGLALSTQQDGRRSIYEQPSVKDQVLQEAQQRAGAVIGNDVGDESSVQPVITLESGTPLVLVFGL